MQEHETLGEYNARVCNLSNEASILGEQLLEERFVQKILR